MLPTTKYISIEINDAVIRQGCRNTRRSKMRVFQYATLVQYEILFFSIHSEVLFSRLIARTRRLNKS